MNIGGFDGPVNLALTGLPDGVVASNAVIQARQSTAQIRLTAAPTTKIAALHVQEQMKAS